DGDDEQCEQGDGEAHAFPQYGAERWREQLLEGLTCRGEHDVVPKFRRRQYSAAGPRQKVERESQGRWLKRSMMWSASATPSSISSPDATRASLPSTTSPRA